MISIIKDKKFYQEVLIKTIILIIFFYFFRSLVFSSKLKIVALIFPNMNSLFSLYKFFFLAVTLLVILEYLIQFELPANFLLSRVIGLTVMFMVSSVLFGAYYVSFGSRIRTAFLLLTTVISILFGQVISYRVQRKRNFRWSYSLGFFNYFLITALLMGATLLNPNGLLFSETL
ncbi:MAG TPA: hypothetical protein VIK96_00670 [Bacilli bacterium]